MDQRTLTAFCALGAIISAVCSPAAEPNLAQKLERPVSVTWRSSPVRSALANLSRAEHVAILLDRRIDPDREIDMEASQERLERVLLRVADRIDAGLSVVGAVAYVGPKPTATKLRTLAELRRDEAKRCAPAQRGKLLAARTWRWSELTTPEQLLSQLLSAADVSLIGKNPLPHDLFAAGDLPALPWTDRLTLLMAQFDLTFELLQEGKAVHLIPIPDRVELTRSYAFGARAAGAASQLQKVAPDASIRREGDQLIVTGRAEDHDVAAQLLRGEAARRTTVQSGKQVYSLSVQDAPLRGVLQALAAKLGREFAFDDAAIERAKIELDQLVSVKVQDKSLSELLDAALTPSGLDFRLEGQTIRIFPAARK